MAQSHRFKKQHCPTYQTLLDAMTGPTGSTPKVGSLAVCINCTAINAVQPDFTLKSLSEAETSALPGELQEYLRQMQGAIRARTQMN